jgi:hypothetical protein
MAFYRLEVKE